MSIKVTRNRSTPMRHTVQVGAHRFTVDSSVAEGGEGAGPTPHELYDSALGACKALTLLWYANRKNMPVEDIEVTVERDDSAERQGLYKLRTAIAITGPLTDAQRSDLLRVASKCPVHKLMTEVTTEIETVWA